MPPSAEHNVIAVMGVTGSGKSSFIKGITGNSDVKVGLSLRSETSEIQTFRLRTPSGSVIGLVDTPGFDDTGRPDFEVLEQFANWVQKEFAGGPAHNLTGILFFHPITHNRLQGSTRRMLSTFKKLLGDDYFKKVVLITTFWNDVDTRVGEQRERELRESCDAWKPLITAGAQVERMARDYARFIPLLERMAASSAPPQLLIQKELSQGKSLEHTMAGLSLRNAWSTLSLGLQEPKDSKLKATAQGSSNGAQPCQDARDARKEAYRLRYEEEVRAQQLENDRILAELRERESRHNALREQRRKELEEQRRLQREIRKAREAEREKEEAQRLKETYETIAGLQHKASRHLEAHACEVIDQIRAYSASDMLPVDVAGIQQEGIGFFGNGPRGKDETTYSVERSGLNIWCDACRNPIGAMVRFVWCICGTGYCEPCKNIGRGCLQRQHTLVRDTSLQDGPDGCRRVLQPKLPLWCDGLGCRDPIEGLYFHCCCDGREVDLCRNCVLLRKQTCFDDNHALEWGVRPIPMSRFSTESLDEQLSADLPQKIVTGHDAWMNAIETPPKLALSASRYHQIMSVRRKVEGAIKKGDVMVEIDLHYQAFCDFCLRTVQHVKNYHCRSHHPETGFSNVALCETCWHAGLSCPSGHAMFVTDGIPTSCRRIQADPDTLDLMCELCFTRISGVYFHCCDCDENYELCVNCVLVGAGCRGSAKGRHTLKMLFLP